MRKVIWAGSAAAAAVPRTLVVEGAAGLACATSSAGLERDIAGDGAGRPLGTGRERAAGAMVV
jgi:hypothetical protein